MYQCAPSFVLGFHGCDRKTGEDILSNKSVHEFSNNKYDWLGSGIYFWENDPIRAEAWANEPHNRKCIKEPFVIGAVIDLRRCLNLLQIESLLELKTAHQFFKDLYVDAGYASFPENKSLNGKEKLVRNLDCAVIEMVHVLKKNLKQEPYDTIRGVFFEGEELYTGAGFREKNHIQICVRNRNCIKGYFLPRSKGADLYPDSLLNEIDISAS